ncbi:MAG: aminotransferase class I/II-fold pyridoxal phosphate-dependent enzyme [Firmicutes bacterium]|nr:aminotransferase class I/II-fold pyridoxal phosphate-dependent enzyme [Bacillota bacterium]
MKHPSRRFSTLAIHAGNNADKTYGALVMPIYQSSTFRFDNPDQGARRFTGEEEGFIYSRLGNPTTAVLQDKLAVLESGEAALAFSSGMGAISSAILTICQAGDHIVADELLYGGVYDLLAHIMPCYGIETSFVNTQDVTAFQDAFRPNTKLLYLETPANPNLKITDLRAASALAKAYDKRILVMCDNTFATPYLQQPLKLGCDIAAHSLTKYLNGHGDVIGGALISNKKFIQEVANIGLKNLSGAVLSAFDSYLVLRGIKTLELRMERHCASALQVAEFLQGHPAIRQVYYPGLPQHPGHTIAKAQMHAFGGMVAFELKGGRSAGAKLLNSLSLITLAVSLGDTETLIEHPATMTHSTYNAEELAAAHISEDLVRLSVGLEDVLDIIDDLQQGLDALMLK